MSEPVTADALVERGARAARAEFACGDLAAFDFLDQSTQETWRCVARAALAAVAEAAGLSVSSLRIVAMYLDGEGAEGSRAANTAALLRALAEVADAR